MKELLIAMTLLAYTLPAKLTYEGRLYTVEGEVYTGQADITFRLYSEKEGGTPIWEESTTVEVRDGFFTAILGEVNSLPDPLPTTLFLGVEVNSSGEMSPRLEITPAPYSMVSDTAIRTLKRYLHRKRTALIVLEWCVEDPSTCCFHSTAVYHTLDSLSGEIGGDLLISFSALLQADGTGNAGEERGYFFYLSMDGAKLYSSGRNTIPKSKWGMSSIAITYMLPNVPFGNHTFEIKYCAINPNVTGGTRLWEYNFDVIQLP